MKKQEKNLCIYGPKYGLFLEFREKVIRFAALAAFESPGT